MIISIHMKSGKTLIQKGVKTVLESNFYQPKRSNNGKVTLKSVGFSDGSKKIFTATIQPHELLITARTCLEQLNSFAGTNYIIFNQAK